MVYQIKTVYGATKEYILSLSPEILEGFAAGAMVLAVSGLLISVILIAARWKMFRRAGIPGWHSIIPVLSGWDLYTLAWGQKAAAVVLILNLLSLLALPYGLAKEIPWIFYGVAAIGIVLAAMELMCLWKLCRAFGKGFWFFFGMLCFPAIFSAVLGFGELPYSAPAGRK